VMRKVRRSWSAKRNTIGIAKVRRKKLDASAHLEVQSMVLDIPNRTRPISSHIAELQVESPVLIPIKSRTKRKKRKGGRSVSPCSTSLIPRKIEWRIDPPAWITRIGTSKTSETHVRHVQSRHLPLYQLGPIDDLHRPNLPLFSLFDDESRLRPNLAQMPTFPMRADVLPNPRLTLLNKPC
jgi:hypothetical protein